MRILLDQAVHDHRNIGNNALLQVALGRLRQFWPEATFDVLSISPHFCRTYLPGTRPVSPLNLLPRQDRISKVHRFAPEFVWRLAFEARHRLNKHSGTRNGTALTAPQPEQPSLPHCDPGGKASSGQATGGATANLLSIGSYDLYAGTGGGYMCDSDKRFLMPMLDRIEVAVAKGVPTVLLSQGVGPLADPELIGRAREVLPLADRIFVRESRVALSIFDRLNIDPGKVSMTGDDAIEPAYRARKASLGTGIGLSLRLAHYTGVETEHLPVVREVLVSAARRYRAPVVAAPIDANDADLDHINATVKGCGRVLAPRWVFATPTEIIRLVSMCRVMVSGTFHGAVFALSQGIPVVALSNSVEYFNKISGLAAEFGSRGCQIVQLAAADAESQLAFALEQAWAAADELRPSLLRSAQRQISLACAAYRGLPELVNGRKRCD